MFSVKHQRPPPNFIQRWPRSRRLGVAYALLAMNVIIVIPVLVTAFGSLLGVNNCGSRVFENDQWICTDQGRLFAVLIGISVLLPPGLWWARFLQSIIGFRADLERTGGEHRPPSRASDFAPGSFGLPFGQQLISGEIEQWISSFHAARISGTNLYFWSAYPFYAGWLKQGDQLHVVYQRIPMASSLKVALAFRVAGSTVFHGVAVREHFVGLTLALICTWTFVWVTVPPRSGWAVLCAVGALMSAIYLILVIKARRALRAFER